MLGVLVFLFFIPIFMFLVECVAALLPKSANILPIARPKIAVLVPAHNEAVGIRNVLDYLMSQLLPGDQLIVVADNCTDDTAAIARATGATVIERHDVSRRGKGYALDYGIRFLEAAGPEAQPDVVVVNDADCLVHPGCLDQIARQAMATGRPSQAIYLMEQPKEPKPKDAISALAFRVKNQVRLQGLHRLGLPCLLTGTGMAFPWPVIQAASLASGNLVEDMQLSMDLAIAGYPPLFCEEARVTGLMPSQGEAAKQQRTRWEHGHLATMRTQVPRLLKAAIRQRRVDLVMMALDLCIPPLALLVMLWMGAMALSILIGLLSAAWMPALGLAIEGALLLMAVGLAWARFGRSDLPGKLLLSVPLYILWKIPLYLAFVVRPETKWVRTARD